RLPALAALVLAIGLAAGMGLRGHRGPGPQGPPAAGDDKAAAPATPTARTDRHGDPLPQGAIARLGTVRLRTPNESHALAYSPDGRTLMAGGPGGARFWDATTGRPLSHLGGELRGSWGPAALSPDGKLVAVGAWGDERGGAVYETATGRRVFGFGKSG